jgi:hypothetical protein
MMAVLNVRFQFRMTEDEARMLQEMAADMLPDISHAQSLLLRRMIRELYARKQRGSHEEIMQELAPRQQRPFAEEEQKQ